MSLFLVLEAIPEGVHSIPLSPGHIYFYRTASDYALFRESLILHERNGDNFKFVTTAESSDAWTKTIKMKELRRDSSRWRSAKEEIALVLSLPSDFSLKVLEIEKLSDELKMKEQQKKTAIELVQENCEVDNGVDFISLIALDDGKPSPLSIQAKRKGVEKTIPASEISEFVRRFDRAFVAVGDVKNLGPIAEVMIDYTSKATGEKYILDIRTMDPADFGGRTVYMVSCCSSADDLYYFNLCMNEVHRQLPLHL